MQNIYGHFLFICAEDDVLWDPCRSIRCMEARLSERKHSCTCEALLYKNGTHFILSGIHAEKMFFDRGKEAGAWTGLPLRQGT